MEVNGECGVSTLELFIFFFLLHSMQGISSLTKDQTHATSVEALRVSTTGPPGKSQRGTIKAV